MNYCQRDKVFDDLELELDTLCKLIGLLSDYIELKDIKTDINNIYAKFNLINRICSCLRTYNETKKINTTNQSMINNRRILNSKIKELYLKLLSDRILLEETNF